MGCLKKLFGLIIFVLLICIFFATGTFTFLKNKYDEYTRPKRAVFVEQEKDFGDLSAVSADYSLSRSLNFFGYRKLNVLYIPKKQKISILDLNSNDFIQQSDFKPEVLKEKIEEFSAKIFNSPIIPVENINIVEIGKIKASDVEIPYADFEADVKLLPFLKTQGTIALYKTKNRENLKDKIKKTDGITSKLLISCKFSFGYDKMATRNFISQIKL